MAVPPCHVDGDDRAEDERDLVRAGGGIVAEEEERQAEQPDQRDHWHERCRETEGRRVGWPGEHRRPQWKAVSPASVAMVVPFSPRTAAGTSASEQMIARPPVARANCCAASTFGPMEPAGKS